MNEEKDIFDFIEKRKVDVPDKAYFENLTQKIVSSQKTRVIPFYKQPITWIGAAAAVALIFMVVRFESPQEVVEPNVLVALDDIPREDILAYVEDNIEDFDIDLISEYIPKSALESKRIEIENEEVDGDPAIETISFDDITTDDILDYFEDEDIDFSDLDDDSFI